MTPHASHTCGKWTWFQRPRRKFNTTKHGVEIGGEHIHNQISTVLSLSNDPGKWPPKLSFNDIKFLIENHPPQVRDFDYPKQKQQKIFRFVLL